MAADRFKRIGRLWKESRQESARGPNLRPLNMTIAARTRHLASHLPSCVACWKAIPSHLDRRIPSLKFSKVQDIPPHAQKFNGSSQAACRTARDSTQTVPIPYTKRATLSKPVFLRCSAEGNPANRRSENTSHATACTQVRPHLASNPAQALPPLKVSCASPRH